MTGCHQLNANLARNVRYTRCSDVGSVLNLDAILESCRALPSLEALVVHPEEGSVLLKEPIKLDNLPSTLRTLKLNFSMICSLFCGFEFATRTPSLVELCLRGYTKEKLALESFLLPPSLEVLTLEPSSGLTLVPSSDIAKLPRTLVKLRLSVDQLVTETSEKYDWPPSLTDFRLHSWNSRLTIECLPRTLHKLDLIGFSTTHTAFPQKSAGRVFPWRVFFPHLSQLSTSRYERNFDDESLLRSIVAPEPWERQEAEAFFSKDSSNPAPSATSSLKDFPNFTKLDLPSSWWSQDTGKIIETLRSLAPFIQDVDFAQLSGEASLLKHAGATSSAELYSDTREADGKLPSTLTRINGRDVHISTLPSTFRSLQCYNLIGKDPSDRTMISGDDFPNLTFLQLFEPATTHTISILPATLTELHIVIGVPEEWDLIASRLISLRKLQITLDAHWRCNSPLTLIKSTYLKAFDLSTHYNYAYDPTKPHLGEFFSHPSPLPSTVVDLNLGGVPVPASILAVLPRGLKDVYINGFSWTDLSASGCLPYPEGANLSHAEIIKSLPPRLRSLHLSKGSDKGQKAIEVECLRFLPHTLRSFSTYDVFIMEDKNTMEELVPPLAANMSFGFTEKRSISFQYITVDEKMDDSESL